jgi:hypothetical protein
LSFGSLPFSFFQRSSGIWLAFFPMKPVRGKDQPEVLVKWHDYTNNLRLAGRNGGMAW